MAGNRGRGRPLSFEGRTGAVLNSSSSPSHHSLVQPCVSCGTHRVHQRDGDPTAPETALLGVTYAPRGILGGPMRSRSLLIGLLAIGAAGLTACQDDATGPSPTVEPAPTVPDLAIATNTWIVRATMPQYRTGVAAVTVTNAAGQPIVYAIGGLNPVWESPQQTVTAYNAATNTWTVKQPLPLRLSRTNGAAAINGKIYISGGCRDRKCFYPTNALYMYDPARDVWTQKREIPPDSSNGPDGENHYADGNGVSGVINGKLYVVSGCFENDS